MQGNKRAHSPKNEDGLPPLPQIAGDRLLQVFTHKSLRMPGVSLSEADDNERLSALGERTLELAVYEALMGERPALGLHELETRSRDILDGDVIETWVEKYRLRAKVRCIPDVRSKLSSREETRALFLAYAGGVYLEQGPAGLKQWIEGLLGLEPERKMKNMPSATPHTKSFSNSPIPHSPHNFMANFPSMHSTSLSSNGMIKSPPAPMPSVLPSPLPPFTRSASSQPQLHTYQAPFQPAPPTVLPTKQLTSTPPPPSPSSSKASQINLKHQQAAANALPPPPYQPKLAVPNPMAPAQPGLAFLPLFNQTAAQRRVIIEYKAEFTGPAHAGKWYVTCIVNGLPKGTGTGGNKQIAKEEAARAAYYSMGWS